MSTVRIRGAGGRRCIEQYYMQQRTVQLSLVKCALKVVTVVEHMVRETVGSADKQSPLPCESL